MSDRFNEPNSLAPRRSPADARDPVIFFAARFAASPFLDDLRRALAKADGTPCDALAEDAATSPQARAAIVGAASVVIVGLPKLALSLSATLNERLTLILDGAEGLDERRVGRLKHLRVATFNFALYTALRQAGADAACFSWAPPGLPAESLVENEVFIEAGAWPRIGALSALAQSLGDAQFSMPRPQNLREQLSRLLCARASTLAPERIAQAQARAGVFLASGRGCGLDGGFLPAMARGAMVIAPARGLFTQYLTRDVSGVLDAGDLAVSSAKMKAMGAAARRVATHARRRFEEDRDRLRDFVSGAAVTRRTFAHVAWPAARKAAPPAPETHEGGSRLRGVVRSDAPDAPLVTVAIVVRNARESFGPTFASARAQDYPNVEIIAVDGRSTDGTRDEIAARDAHLDYWLSEADRGPYDGMNKAARLARGRFLIFMNAGDFFASERAISEAFDCEAARAADVVVGHHVYVDAQGVEKLCKNADFNWTYERVARGDLSWEWYNGVPCGQAVFIRSALLRAQPFPLEYKIAADHAFLYGARASGHTFFHCDSIIGVYTSGGLSGASERGTAGELLRVARAFGPREKIDAWFKRNLPVAFDEAR